MKSFNLNEDAVYTFSSFGERIVFTSASISRRAFDDLVQLNDGPNQVKSYIHWRVGEFSGGFYQTAFDRDHTRPESIPLIDFTFGVSVSSSLCGLQAYLSSNCEFYPQKNRMYRLYAQELLGEAGRIFQIDGVDRHELIFLNIRRNQFKDNISPGTLKLTTVYSGSIGDLYEGRLFSDESSDAGVDSTEGGIRGNIKARLRTSVGVVAPGDTLTGSEVGRTAGHVYYQAGVLVLVPELFSHIHPQIGNHWYTSGTVTASYDNLARNNTGSNVDFNDTISGIRQRILELDFRSNSRLRSTFYTCTAARNEYNYSSNPSFVSAEGRIIPTSGVVGAQSRTYITKVGLLGANGELIAIGQLSRPVRKDSDTEVEIVVRVDY